MFIAEKSKIQMRCNALNTTMINRLVRGKQHQYHVYLISNMTTRLSSIKVWGGGYSTLTNTKEQERLFLELTLSNLG